MWCCHSCGTDSHGRNNCRDQCQGIGGDLCGGLGDPVDAPGPLIIATLPQLVLGGGGGGGEEERGGGAEGGRGREGVRGGQGG